MSPARRDTEQSTNTLRFAKEVRTNADVDKALVKHLQEEITRLEKELRSNQPNFNSLNYSALLREKDAQIEKVITRFHFLRRRAPVEAFVSCLRVA